MLLLIDNYDSFVYNLARYFTELGCATHVVRNDEIDVAGVQQLAPQAIVISPGPCTPNEAGISMELISKLSSSIPTLGVCLGHQAIAAALGGQVVRAPEPVHGRASLVYHDDSELFTSVPQPFSSRSLSFADRRGSLTSTGTYHYRPNRGWPADGTSTSDATTLRCSVSSRIGPDGMRSDFVDELCSSGGCQNGPKHRDGLGESTTNRAGTSSSRHDMVILSGRSDRLTDFAYNSFHINGLRRN